MLIRAFAAVASEIPSAELIIAGSGEEENNLKDAAGNLTLNGHIKFLGKVSETEKIKLLQRPGYL